METRITQRKSRVRIGILALITALAISVLFEYGFGEEPDPVLEYYWNKAGAEFQRQNDLRAESKYILRALTYYHHVDKRGVITKTDTLLADYIISGDIIDSVHVLEGIDEPRMRANFSVPDIFSFPSTNYFFPNDTGGMELAIGFDTDTAYSELPDGILLIDRYRFSLRWLYTHYSDTTGYKHLSRSYRFSEFDGIFFMDSIWEIGARPGLMSSDSYRRETAIHSLKIHE